MVRLSDEHEAWLWGLAVAAAVEAGPVGCMYPRMLLVTNERMQQRGMGPNIDEVAYSCRALSAAFVCGLRLATAGIGPCVPVEPCIRQHR